jgi:hypothetical protein
MSEICSRCGKPINSPDCLCCSTSILERLRRGPLCPARLRLNPWGILSLACATVVFFVFVVVVVRGARQLPDRGPLDHLDLPGFRLFLRSASVVFLSSLAGTLFGGVGIQLRGRYGSAASAWVGLAINFLFLSPFLLFLAQAVLTSLLAPGL